MTNTLLALAKQDTLSELDQIVYEEAASEAGAFNLVPTKITIAPGGINQFVTSDGETMKTLTAIVAISQKARAYWPDSGTGSPPFCSSRDDATGIVNLAHTPEQFKAAASATLYHPAVPLLSEQREIPASFPCTGCSLNDWDAARRLGLTRIPCKELRRLVVLVDGWTQPALLTLPPTSLRAFDSYASSLSQRKSAYFAVWTQISLTGAKALKGEPYSTAAFTVAAQLTEVSALRAVIQLRSQYAELVRSMDIVSEDYDNAARAANYSGPTPPDEDAPLF